ncbi:stage III sporulation protein AF [Cohnella candidum]|uniref:Stage III sporulation protein AF n=1 Tax=Cohnella candidum TaxID=2674991 RepID=A0A3G3JX61_9BACL|nr:stage III sporulation protein AF [Cohnella candidum]AYQ72832.1 stage III sporulation protein AF [Cohnella candidum]
MGLMEGLSGWLKQIVAVVLLAGLVDLLLPNKTMQRYVRLVAGLFILLTVATPMLNWLHSDFGNRLAAGLETSQSDDRASAEELSKIKEEGRKWQAKQQEEAEQVTAGRLRDAIKEDVEQSEGRKVVQVAVQLRRSPEGQLDVESVTVTMAGPEAGTNRGTGGTGGTAEAGGDAEPDPEASPGSKPVEQVQPVAPVIVEIPPSDRAAGGEAEENPADRETRSRVTALLSAKYGVPANRVQVLAADAADERR